MKCIIGKSPMPLAAFFYNDHDFVAGNTSWRKEYVTLRLIAAKGMNIYSIIFVLIDISADPTTFTNLISFPPPLPQEV